MTEKAPGPLVRYYPAAEVLKGQTFRNAFLARHGAGSLTVLPKLTIPKDVKTRFSDVLFLDGSIFTPFRTVAAGTHRAN